MNQDARNQAYKNLSQADKERIAALTGIKGRAPTRGELILDKGHFRAGGEEADRILAAQYISDEISNIASKGEAVSLYRARLEHWLGPVGSAAFVKELPTNPTLTMDQFYANHPGFGNPGMSQFTKNGKIMTMQQYHDSVVASIQGLSGSTNTPPKAARGGVFSGPTGGYPIEMHGTEMVAPLNVDSILMKLAKTPAGATDSETAINSIIQPNGRSSTDIEKVVAVQSRMIDLLDSKLDTVINVLETGNYTQNKILRHSLA